MFKQRYWKYNSLQNFLIPLLKRCFEDISFYSVDSAWYVHYFNEVVTQTMSARSWTRHFIDSLGRRPHIHFSSFIYTCRLNTTVHDECTTYNDSAYDLQVYKRYFQIIIHECHISIIPLVYSSNYVDIRKYSKVVNPISILYNQWKQ